MELLAVQNLDRPQRLPVKSAESSAAVARRDGICRASHDRCGGAAWARVEGAAGARPARRAGD